LGNTYIPLAHERVDVAEGSRYCLILKIGLVLLQQSAARLGVLFLRHGILKIGLFESVEGNDNAIDFGQRLIEIPFSGRRS